LNTTSPTAGRPRTLSNRFDTGGETGAGAEIDAGRALQLKLIANPVQVELPRFADSLMRWPP
jgi:hypothetical protein